MSKKSQEVSAAIALILANADSFSVGKDGKVDLEKITSELAAQATRGDSLATIARKTDWSESDDEAGEFLDSLLAMADVVVDHVIASGTSGMYRMSVDTEHGKFSVVLDPTE